PHAGVLVEDLDDLADVLAQEGLAAGGEEEHEAPLPHAGRQLVDLLERELLLAVDHGRLFPSRVRAVGEQTVLALRVACVGDEVDQVDRQLPAFPEHLPAVSQVVEVAHLAFALLAPRGQYRRPSPQVSMPTPVPAPTTSS